MAVVSPSRPDVTRRHLLSGVYCIEGQSNAVGIGTIAEAPVGMQGVIPGAYIWNDVAGAWQPLQAGVNNLGNTSADFGPELKFAYDMTQAGAEVWIIKYAVVGTSLALSWKPDTGPQWIASQGVFARAMAAYTALGKLLPMRGYMFFQCESDANSLAVATAYEQSLQTYRSRRLGVFEDAGYGPKNMRFITHKCKRTDGPAFVSQVVASQQAACAAMPDSHLIDTTNFTQKPDKVHYDTAGQIALGAAAARCFL